MTNEEIYHALADAVVNLDVKNAGSLAEQAISKGIDPVDILD